MNKLKLYLYAWYRIFLDFMMLFTLPKRIAETKNTNTPIKFKHWLFQKLLGRDRKVYWQVHPQSTIRGIRNIFVGIEVSPGYEKGCYIQAINPVFIGDYTQIANNVGIISANHDLFDTRIHLPAKPVIIGSFCWIGMGAIILPEVELGDFTIVGAGAIVTKSFPEGHCVIAGNPAKVIKILEKEKCVRYKNENEYYGFYKKGTEFNNYINRNINEETKKIVRLKSNLRDI